MRPVLLAFFLSTIALPLFGQLTLEGVWKGTLTTSIHSQRGYPFELYLYREGSRVWGRSYITVQKDSTIVMDLAGKMYPDRSISLRETQFSGDTMRGPLTPYFRRYQLIFKRGLFDASLNGFWQEVREGVFDDDRNRGRIYLRKDKADKA
jgi:hypothetical protein